MTITKIISELKKNLKDMDGVTYKWLEDFISKALKQKGQQHKERTRSILDGIPKGCTQCSTMQNGEVVNYCPTCRKYYEAYIKSIK